MALAKSVKIPVGGLAREFARADIEFHELDHAGPSYEGRVFINNPGANETTERLARTDTRAPSTCSGTVAASAIPATAT